MDLSAMVVCDRRSKIAERGLAGRVAEARHTAILQRSPAVAGPRPESILIRWPTSKLFNNMAIQTRSLINSLLIVQLLTVSATLGNTSTRTDH